ncbi:uncharacterized protein I303_101533 [Kwoniella dejecticola CBS 10117]|uniref:Cytoplasmic protein n=1 Tax=Kwoniella dejecticola CBS 10117 TaxID=1296121 RepID=A0A1A6ADG8_9TREE|nr:cytoplasmic protein [Kwoniella dejecticola CBS 10117]OBR88116.1 cytoplasmic protein [Kwoniella dejecticola CBS 10117]
MPSANFVHSDDAPPVLVPPINFSLVVPGIYRSGHPNKKNFSFLRRLNLSGVIYLENESEAYRSDSSNFILDNGLKLYRYDLSKESNLFTREGSSKLNNLLEIILDKRNYPLLLHDDTGKGTVSLVCALIRRMQNWSLTGAFAEGDLFAGPAGGSEGVGLGEAGMEFIASFEPKKVKFDRANKPDWVD